MNKLGAIVLHIGVLQQVTSDWPASLLSAVLSNCTPMTGKHTAVRVKLRSSKAVCARLGLGGFAKQHEINITQKAKDTNQPYTASIVHHPGQLFLQGAKPHFCYKRLEQQLVDRAGICNYKVHVASKLPKATGNTLPALLCMEAGQMRADALQSCLHHLDRMSTYVHEEGQGSTTGGCPAGMSGTARRQAQLSQLCICIICKAGLYLHYLDQTS